MKSKDILKIVHDADITCFDNVDVYGGASALSSKMAYRLHSSAVQSKKTSANRLERFLGA